MSLLEVRDLRVLVGDVPAIDGVSFSIEPGQRVGLIGESGCGKSLTALSIMGLLPDGLCATGSVCFEGVNLLDLPEERVCHVRGDRIGMVFQEPMTALNPVMRIGDQIGEALRIHRGHRRAEARAKAADLLARVHMPDAGAKLRAYPHQLSGGQRQRAMLAAAVACGPALLIADEPTTALDVTVQAQMLVLLDGLVREEGMGLLLITHDLPVVAGMCEEVLVMYGGHLVEQGEAQAVFAEPRHPYTAGLVAAIPEVGERARSQRLRTVPGSVPPLGAFPAGCVYRDRCPRADDVCREMPPLEGTLREVACWHPVTEAAER